MNKSTREIERDVERTRSDIEDTVEALRDKMSIGQMLDEAGHYLRASGGGEVVANLAAQARANPLPLALIGIGLAWLMSGRGQPSMNFYRRSHAGNGGNGSSFRREGYGSGEAGESDTGWKAGEAVSSRLHQVSDTASQAYGKASDTASQAFDKVSDTASQTYGRISDTAARVSDTYHRVSDRAGQAQRTVSELIESEPLILAGLGLAVGAAIGAMMPATQTESRFLGEKLDEFKESASEMASDQWEKTKSLAMDAASAAKAEIDKSGLMGDAAERAAKSSTRTADQSPTSKGLGSSARKS